MNVVLAAATSVALVLSGGGGRGAYQIGVWKALNELGIEIAAVYGTSVGAINGALIAIGDFEFAEKSWLDITFEDVMDIPESVKKIITGRFTDLTIPEAIDAAKQLISEGGIDITPLREKMKNLLPEEKIRTSKVHYGLVAYSLSELKPYMLYIEEIPQGMLADYILSSANFPLFKREEIGGRLFVDGGVYSNIPVKMAIERGYENIIVVDIGTIGVADILEYIRIFSNQGRIEYIRPREHFGTVLTFDSQVSKKYLTEGYLDTLAHFGKLFGESYYISDNEDLIQKLFINLRSVERDIAASLLGIRLPVNLSAQAQYEEYILPRLRLETLSPFAEPALVCRKLLEDVAKFLKVERLKVYTSYDLLKAIVSASSPSGFLDTIMYKTRYRKLIDFLIFLYKNSHIPHSQEVTP
ncbi:MAG TPA: patatin-like phospholipase family protein [Pseudothermotoga sp.]|uniref:patatin-like phospholipase family protein n=1 Tax=Thermotoga profunda TaxID=1508420 RepID=UPI0005978C7D|nr:patatin-like phospholipase family protein [Thermotoga profunda]